VTRSPNVAYVAPFAAFLALLALQSVWPLPDLADQVARISVVGLVIIVASRRFLDFHVRQWVPVVAAGALIFALWVSPDLLFPGYRHSILFENSFAGKVASSLSRDGRDSAAVLALRVVRAVVIVPIAEELFWRGWLMRWLIKPDFQKVRLGSYTAASFWIVAALFATEHGPYWDVGLAAGVVFNGLMLRTRSLGDLIFSHAIANACLCAYVLATGKWEYWL
jgi:CAAX prenyl protease-like protein